MNNFKHTLAKRFIAAVAAAALFTPVIASAQDASYADGGNQQIQGTVSSINGTWNITVSDANGYNDSIQLHQGTVINPTGLTLEPGMNVTIDGYADGPNFDALEIDTPYAYQGPAPTAVYYGPGDWYPGYAAGWGPSFSLFFNLNAGRFERRSFDVAGQVRREVAPPQGWQNRPHGFIGNAGYARPPQQQQRRFVAPQQQQTRSFADQRQAQPQRTFVPQQQRAAALPQQQRAAAPQRDYSSPTSRAGTFTPRGSNQDNGRRRG